MLGFWRSHADYRQFVVAELSKVACINPSALWEYEDEISKLYILDLDPMKRIIAPLYSHTGRPSEFQPEIFRSLVLMNQMGYALDNWVPKLENNFVLRTICGFSDKMPKLASYYDFINRIVKLGIAITNCGFTAIPAILSLLTTEPKSWICLCISGLLKQVDTIVFPPLSLLPSLGICTRT